MSLKSATSQNECVRPRSGGPAHTRHTPLRVRPRCTVASVTLTRQVVLSPASHPASSARQQLKAAAGEDGQPSQDLKDLCTLQLGVLQTLLRSKSGCTAPLRATVYVRVPGPNTPAGTVLLQRVAGTLSATASTDSMDGLGGHVDGSQQSVVMLQLGASGIMPSGTAPASDVMAGAPLAEACLVSEEILVLPSSGSLVLPLVDGQSLVGLLLVEPSRPPQAVAGGPGSMQASTSSQEGTWSEDEEVVLSSMAQGQVDTTGLQRQPAGTVGGVATSVLPATDLQKPGLTVSAHQPIADGHFITPGPEGIPTTLIKQYAGFTDEEVHALRVVAPLLAKACAMELRAALQLSAAAAQTAVASRLLRDATRPATALNTFAAMLLPRMEQGSADRDMVQGIAQQGKRLREVLRQLDAALSAPLPHVTPKPGRAALAAAPAHAPRRSRSIAGPTPAVLAAQHAPAITEQPAPARQHTALPATAGSTAPAPTGNPAAASQPSGTATHTAHSTQQPTQTASSQAAAPLINQPHQHTAAPLSRQSHQHTQPVSAEAPPSPPQPATSTGLSTADSLSGTQEPEPPRTFTMRLATDTSVSSDGVIDMELDSPGSSTPLSGTARPRAGRGQQQARHLTRPQRPHTAASHVSHAGPWTEVAPALVGVLTAAAKLAVATGITFTVHPPLHTALPARHTSQPAHANGHRRMSQVTSGQHTSRGTGGGHHGSVDIPQLLPRPELPLHVAVATSTLQRIAAYVVDLALQCTAPGGSVAVTASSVVEHGVRWVQLVVAHTGLLVTQCLHPRPPVMHSPGTHAASTRRPQHTTSIVSHPSQRATTQTQPLVPPATLAAAAQPMVLLLEPPAPSHRHQHQQLTGHRGVQQPAEPAGVAHQAPVQAPAASGLPPGAGLPSGGGLLSFAMAEELILQVGGQVWCDQPVPLRHPDRGTLEQGTRLVIQLPTEPPRAVHTAVGVV